MFRVSPLPTSNHPPPLGRLMRLGSPEGLFLWSWARGEIGSSMRGPVAHPSRLFCCAGVLAASLGAHCASRYGCASARQGRVGGRESSDRAGSVRPPPTCVRALAACGYALAVSGLAQAWV